MTLHLLSEQSLPANCLSPFPRLPNLVMSLPVSWKMKTVHALLSTTITWPFWSTDTPFGPISLPEPSFACWAANTTNENDQDTVSFNSDNKMFKGPNSKVLESISASFFTSWNLPCTCHRLRRCWPTCCRSQRWWCPHWGERPHLWGVAVAPVTVPAPQNDFWIPLRWRKSVVGAQLWGSPHSHHTLSDL